MEAPASSLIGRTLAGSTTLDAYLGEGGFARIYQGRRGTPPVDVAIKVLHAEFLADAVFLLRFEREAKTAISVAHPNAVRILEYGVDDGLAFIVMELVRGVSLFDVLAREGRLSQKRAVKIVAQICDALEAAHGQGIIHRDVKPENIMLLGDPTDPVGEWVKVLDFGIAKLLFDEGADLDDDDGQATESKRAALTGLGTVIGTPEYMAPEQLRGDPIDGRADVYACGILLYQLVTGQLPFNGVTPAHTAVLQMQEPPRPPREIAPDIHAELEWALLQALSKSPADRQQSAEQLRDQLTRLTRVVPDTAEPLPADALRPALEFAPTVAVATPAGPVGSVPSAPAPPDAATVAPDAPAAARVAFAAERAERVSTSTATGPAPVMGPVVAPGKVVAAIAVVALCVVAALVLLFAR